MQIFTKTELQLHFSEIAEQINSGAVFIYPTDTIYGIGCNALDTKAVNKIRALKERQNNPFSIIAPSKEWITENCVITKEGKEWLNKLPGPYTIILKLNNEKNKKAFFSSSYFMNNKNAVAKNVNPGEQTIGIRIPDHWFSSVVQRLGFPIVTTSANLSAKPFMTSLEDLDPAIKRGVDFIIYEGEKKGRPSKIINLVDGKIKER